ncbi:MAG TPA: FhaA domain-containing protein [Blastocatellia bacterium]|nr:FhaA domain-containing protein [Blastocatellia bacterium]
MSGSQPEKTTDMTEQPPELAGRFETFVRRLFERIGGALDFALRRPLNPQPRTDLTALIPPIERAIEAHLRREGSRVIAPNLIELRYDYETYSQLTKLRVEFLQRELRTTVYEYIHNRRYATLGDVQVKIGFDVFTRGLAIKTQFPDEVAAARGEAAAKADQSEASDATPAAAATQQATRRCELILKAATGARFGNFHTALSSDGTPAGIGRSRDNRITIDDSTVSSFHAAVTLAASGSVVVSDLGSSNGTFVNGVRIAAGDRSIIRAGDRLRFGDVEVTVEISDGG